MSTPEQAAAPLLKKSRQGDLPSFRQLYELYAKAMYNICLRMLNDREDAEDVLQDAFVQVYKNLSQFRGEASVGAWIKRIVVNQCLNHLRKKKFRWEPLAQLEMQEEEGINEAEFEWTVSRVNEAIRQLPDGYRLVLSLYLFEDYSHKEIAQFLGISESTAKTQYMRAKEKVRQLMRQRRNITETEQ